MSEAVAFNNVSKRFVLRRERAYTILESLIGLVRPARVGTEEFWALKDVSFAIPAGQTFGIVGPNGAGKSTILKLMSRILEPTSGQVAVRGRVSPLLELGAGFHPELTGRENVYLNAALFGVTEAEAHDRFDEIVEFSELKDFIDVPLKHYSSGMYMRLGFAVAANIIPDVLLVDEVLAVGDEAYQRKCLKKIQEFRTEGRTIVFVSHDLPTVRQICHQALWLDQGRVQALGPTDDVVDAYLRSMAPGE
jgi:ABC-type polysaccharide/polyol phosphate transport system ATPase subunit